MAKLAPRTPTKKRGATPSPTAEVPPGSTPSTDDIRVRAYHRYLERGASHGRDFDDWLEAEKDLTHPRHN